jgi:hypothetical protein
MFGRQPKDDLLDELKEYNKGRDNDIFEDYDSETKMPDSLDENNSGRTYFDKKQTDFSEDFDLPKNKKQGDFASQNSMLMADENVIWQGKSVYFPGNEKLSRSIQKLFGWVWLIFAIIWTFFAMLGSLFFALFGIPFIVIGIGLITGRFSAAPTYIITNKRIIIKNSKKSSNVLTSSVYFSQITDLSYDMTGENVGFITYNSSSNKRYSSGSIYGITNPEQVYNSMCNEIRKTLS